VDKSEDVVSVSAGMYDVKVGDAIFRLQRCSNALVVVSRACTGLEIRRQDMGLSSKSSSSTTSLNSSILMIAPAAAISADVVFLRLPCYRKPRRTCCECSSFTGGLDSLVGSTLLRPTFVVTLAHTLAVGLRNYCSNLCLTPTLCALCTSACVRNYPSVPRPRLARMPSCYV
jgi:hypothetical protein